MAYVLLGCASTSQERKSGLGPGEDPRFVAQNSASCIEIKGKGRSLPFVSSIAPDEGSGLGGTEVTITGEGFQKGATVEIGGSPCYDVNVMNPQTLTCMSGTHPGGLSGVLVINPNRHCGFLAKAFSFIPNVVITPKTKVVSIGNTVAFSAQNGRPPYNFAVITGGGSIDGNGLYKAPSNPGSSVIRVTDAMNTMSDAVVTVNAPLRIVPRSTPGPGGYNFDVVGGAPPITYTVEKASQADTDSPESAKATVIKVMDAAGNEARIALEVNRVTPLVIYPAIIGAVPGDKINFMGSGGYPPYQFSMVAGNGKINPVTGVYQAPMESSQETVKVTDSAGNTMEASITISKEAFSQNRLGLGYAHTCALTNNQVKCWGDNRFGQLGNGTMINKRLPVPVVGLTGSVLSITSGHNFTCALLAGGTVKCWGENRYGQLGDGSVVNSIVPQSVFSLHSGVLAISAGQYHACAVVRGAAYCWGSNRRGQLGNGGLEQSATPVPVKGLGEGVQSLSAGAAHTCALTKDGGVKCWGYNYAGQLGDGTVADRLAPVQVKGLEKDVQTLVVGGYHSCALKKDLKLYCWGANGLGQLGHREYQNSLVPIEVEGVSKHIRHIAAGYFHTCAFDGDRIECWGYNRSGQLGNSISSSHDPTPRIVRTDADLKDLLSIGVGVNHSCALLLSGVSCWGDNSQGQFGNRSLVSSVSPATPADLKE